MSRKSWTVFWLAALLLLFVFNGSLLITDSVESNYALTAKEMVVSGDWLSPQIYGQYWFDKPVFFYWLTALGFKIFGFTEFAARFFPSCFGLAGLGLLIWGAKKLFDEFALICWPALESLSPDAELTVPALLNLIRLTPSIKIGLFK